MASFTKLRTQSWIPGKPPPFLPPLPFSPFSPFASLLSLAFRGDQTRLLWRTCLLDFLLCTRCLRWLLWSQCSGSLCSRRHWSFGWGGFVACIWNRFLFVIWAFCSSLVPVPSSLLWLQKLQPLEFPQFSPQHAPGHRKAASPLFSPRCVHHKSMSKRNQPGAPPPNFPGKRPQTMCS